MNPLRWQAEHLVALAMAMAIGAAVGVVFGYFAYSTGTGTESAASFSSWLHRPLRYAVHGWALFGAVIGAGLVYARWLASN